MQKNERPSIVKSAILVQSKNTHSALAQNIIASLVIRVKKEIDKNVRYIKSNLRADNSLIDSKYIPDHFKVENINLIYKLSRKELADMWGLSIKNRDLSYPKKYQDAENEGNRALKAKLAPPLVKACEEVRTSCFRVCLGSLKKLGLAEKFDLDDGGETDLNLISFVTFNKNGLTIKVNPDTIPVIYDQSLGYAATDLEVFFKLKNKYAKRYYDILCQYKKKPEYTIKYKISDLEQMFECSLSDYTRTETFISMFVDNPLKEILRVCRSMDTEMTWELQSGHKKPFVINRNVKNRTYASDEVQLTLKYVKRPCEQIGVVVNELQEAKDINISVDFEKLKEVTLVFRQLQKDKQFPNKTQREIFKTYNNQLVENRFLKENEYRDWLVEI